MIADPILSESSGLLYKVGRPIELPRQALDAGFRANLVEIVARQAGCPAAALTDAGLPANDPSR